MAFHEVFRVTGEILAEREGDFGVAAFKDDLLEAVLNGDYSEVAEGLAGLFWENAKDGIDTVSESRALFSALVLKFPALREPLQKALNEGNPYKDLLPPLAADSPEK